MLVASAALIAALAGTAFAGVATTSKLSGKEKKQVAKIARKEANKRIAKRAAGLRVAFADSASSAATAARLGKVTVVRQDGEVAPGTGGSVDAFCPAGTQAIAGGGRGDAAAEPRLLASRPAGAGGVTPLSGEEFSGWRVSVYNDTGEPVVPAAWAVCVG
jgi:hypothetical protein